LIVFKISLQDFINFAGFLVLIVNSAFKLYVEMRYFVLLKNIIVYKMFFCKTIKEVIVFIDTLIEDS